MVSKLYINGDSHSAGAELDNDYCFAKDDPNFTNWFLYSKHKEYFTEDVGMMPHYDNLWDSYAGNLSRLINKDLVCDAQSGSSNHRILRSTKAYIKDNRNDFLIIGWTTWERSEIHLDDDTVFQISASGTDNLPDFCIPQYKEWIANMTPEYLEIQEKYWHKTIYDFHKYLQEHNIKHLFFNTYSHFENIPEEEQYDWDGCYFHPYEQAYTFFHYLKNSNFEPNDNYHHNKMAHREWAQVLFDKIRFMM